MSATKTTTRHYEITISPMSGGMQQAQPRQGEGWDDMVDLVSEMRASAELQGRRMVEQGSAEAAEEGIDWPAVVNEPTRLFALVEDDGTVAGYCGIESRDE